MHALKDAYEFVQPTQKQSHPRSNNLRLPLGTSYVSLSSLFFCFLSFLSAVSSHAYALRCVLRLLSSELAKMKGAKLSLMKLNSSLSLLFSDIKH